MHFLRVLTIAFVACVSICVGDDSTGVPLPLWRTVQTKHSSQLATIDRIRVSALSFADEDRDASKPQSKKTYLVLPVSPAQNGAVTPDSPRISVTSLGSRRLVGANAKRIVDEWRSLSIHRYGSLCENPTYGLEFLRGNTLVFKVAICWKCRKISLPTIDPTTGNHAVALYGFDDDASAKKLLNELRRLMPHPQIRDPAPR